MKKKLNKKKIFDTIQSTCKGKANLQGWMDEIDLLVLIKHVLSHLYIVLCITVPVQFQRVLQLVCTDQTCVLSPRGTDRKTLNEYT